MSTDSLLPGPREFAPREFTDRGAAVPYTTPVLAQSRARRGFKDSMELLVPSFSGVKGTYVVRWGDVPAIFRGITLHDRMLHQEIAREGGCNPEHIRRAALKVSRLGVAGPEAAASAKRCLDNDENDALFSNVFLMHLVINFKGSGVSMSLRELMAEAGRQQAKEALAGVAKQTGGTASELYAKIESWSRLIGAIGVPDMAHVPRLRKLVATLSDLAPDLKEWADGDPSEVRVLAHHAALVLAATLEVADNTLAEIDAYAMSPLVTLREWAKTSVEIKAQVERMAWLLDGWEFILHLWQSAPDSDRHAQREAIVEIARILPPLPQSEMPDLKRLDLQTDFSSQRYVKALHGWQSGTPDPHIVARLERMRAAAA